MAEKNTKTPMTDKAARRIQSDADRNQHNEGFKRRSQRAVNPPKKNK